MRMSLTLAATLTLACAVSRGGSKPASIPISVNSHNRSSVDVYLLCGNRDAEWLGVIDGKESGTFEVPISRTRCVHGLNFFLVHRDLNRGYWVGPLRLQTGSSVRLTIEKYAGLSVAQVDNGVR